MERYERVRQQGRRSYRCGRARRLHRMSHEGDDGNGGQVKSGNEIVSCEQCGRILYAAE